MGAKVGEMGGKVEEVELVLELRLPIEPNNDL